MGDRTPDAASFVRANPRDCPDGSLEIASIPTDVLRGGLWEAIKRNPECEIIEVIATVVGDFWIDWKWRGYQFTGTECWGSYDIFVNGTPCSPETACELVGQILNPPQRNGRILRGMQVEGFKTGFRLISAIDATKPASPSLANRCVTLLTRLFGRSADKPAGGRVGNDESGE